MIDSSTPAFARPVRIADLPLSAQTEFAFEATAEERAMAARQLGLPEVERLSASFIVLRRPGDRLLVSGAVRAKFTRLCVVSLEPFEQEVDEPIEIEYAPEPVAAAEAARTAHEPAPGETLADLKDPPDPIVDGRIDLGSLAVEFLALSLDPYPRKPGASFTTISESEAAERSPFAALSKLKLGEGEEP